jgi:O-antigen/teichoic acid export membrane protein
MSSPDAGEEVWEQRTAEIKELAQPGEKGLLSRVIRKRADYFADVNDTDGEACPIDHLPTQRYDAFLQSLGFSLVPLSSLPVTASPLPIEDQPTDQMALREQIADQCQLVALSAASADPGDQPTSILPKLVQPLAGDVASQKTETISIRVAVPRESYGSHLGNLLKRSGIYALASMVSPCVVLALSPFLTRHLTRADYGALTVLTTAIALVAGVSQLGMGAAFFRVYSYDYEQSVDRKHVLAMTLLLLLACAFPLLLVECLCAPWIAWLLLGNWDMTGVVRVAALVIFLQNLTVPGFAWLRAENRSISFAMISIANLLVNLGMTIALVGWYHLGIGGSLLATGCGYLLVLVCTLPRLLWHTRRFRWRMDIARALLSFGLPNAVSFASAWVLQLADRFLLAHMRSLSETATYGVAYTLGGALSVVVLSPFSLAWPSTLFLIARRQDARQVFRLIFRWYSLFLLFMAYALTLAGSFALMVFFPANYQSAGVVIPMVALSTMFYGFYNYFTLGMNICKKLWYAVLFLASAALINIGANLVLIPRYGSLGAAIATLLAYALLAVATYILNQRIYRVSFEIGLAGLGLGLITGSYVLGMLLARGRAFWTGRAVEVIILLLCGTLLFALGWLWTSWHDRRERSDIQPQRSAQEEQAVSPASNRHLSLP